MAPQMPKVFPALSKPNSGLSLLIKASSSRKHRGSASQETVQHSRLTLPSFFHGSVTPSSGRWRGFAYLTALVLVLVLTDFASATVSVPVVIAAAGSSSSDSSSSSAVVEKNDPLEESRITEPFVEVTTDKVLGSKERDSSGGKHSKTFPILGDVILPAKKDQLPTTTSNFITKASLDLLTKRLLASKTKSSQQFLNKLKKKKSENLKASSNSKQAGESNSAKSMVGGVDEFGSSIEYVYEDYQDPDEGQLEIKTESPPLPDLEPIYKGCPVFENGELTGLRPHGATWSEGDDQCEVCECKDGEQRCYYHYCNGPKLGFITPPSAETPTADGEAPNTERIPGHTEGELGTRSTGSVQSNTEQGIVKLENNDTLPGSYNKETLLEHFEETTARQDHLDERTEGNDFEEESSGRPPWSFSDDEDAYYDYDDHDNHINNIGLPSKVDTSSSRKINHLEENSAVHQNHVVFLDDNDPLETFDPLDTFEAVVDSRRLNLGKDSANPASADVAHHINPKTGLEIPDCDTDCSKSCPYGYKITPSSGCPSCKCLKCYPLQNCRLHCPSGFTTDPMGCPVCICSLDTDLRNDNDFGRVHHTLGGIKDTHKVANLTNSSNNHIDNNNNSVVSSLPVHHNDVTYDRTDTTTNNNNNNHHHAKNVDPHNHFYDNAFNILKADELSILRDDDTNNDNNRHGLGPAYRPEVDYTTISSLDGEIYDVDYTVEGRKHESKEGDDLSTTVGWEEVERRHDQEDHGGTGTVHDEEDCNHTAPPVCQDPSGDRHRVGASWRRDPCTVCRCYARGYAECTVTQCHAHGSTRDCGPPPPGECCPRCDGQRRPGSHPNRTPIPAPSPPLQHSGGVPPIVEDSRTDGGDAVKEPVRSDLSSICIVVIGLVSSGSLVACLAIHYWRRYHSAKYEIAGSITAEEAQKLRPVKVNCSDDVTAATPLKPAKCV